MSMNKGIKTRALIGIKAMEIAPSRVKNIRILYKQSLKAFFLFKTYKLKTGIQLIIKIHL